MKKTTLTASILICTLSSLIGVTHVAADAVDQCSVSMPMTPSMITCLEKGFQIDRVNMITPAIERLHANGLTKYATYTDFQTESLITREQAAKFYGEFARTVLKKQIDTTRACTFNDIDQADTTLRSSIITACQLGLFKGSKGNYAPKRTITRAESYAVLGRMLNSTLTDTDCTQSANPGCTRYESYQTFLAEHSLSMVKSMAHIRDQDASPELEADRGGSAYVLYSAAQGLAAKTLIAQ